MVTATHLAVIFFVGPVVVFFTEPFVGFFAEPFVEVGSEVLEVGAAF